LDKFDGWLGEPRHDEQGVSCAGGQGRQPDGHQFAEAGWDRQRLVHAEAPALILQCSSQLECKERIATRGLVHADQRGARQTGAEPPGQQLMDGTEAEWTEAESLERQHPVEAQRSSFLVGNPHGGEQSDRVRVEAAQRKLENVGGRGVEPLSVVDRDEHGTCHGQNAKNREYRERHRPLVRRGPFHLGEQQRALEGPTLGRRDLGQGVDEHAAQKIAEGREGQLHLGSGRAAGEASQ